MVNEEKFFADLQNEMVADAANEQLDIQVTRVVTWKRMCAEEGKDPDLLNLIYKMLTERPRRNQVLAAHAAALWRLAEQREHERHSTS